MRGTEWYVGDRCDGTITKVNEGSVQLQIANNVRVEVSRAAIVGYQGQEPVGEALSQSKPE